MMPSDFDYLDLKTCLGIYKCNISSFYEARKLIYLLESSKFTYFSIKHVLENFFEKKVKMSYDQKILILLLIFERI